MADEIVLRIRGDSQELQRAVSQATASLNGFNVAVKQVGNTPIASNLSTSITNLGSSLSNVGTRLATVFTLPLVGAFAAATKSSADFQSAFANVRKTIGNVPEIETIRTSILALSRQLPQTAVELANMAAIGGQFGISSKGIVDFTKTVAALDLAVDGISAEQAAEGLAQLRTAAGASESDIKRMASSLVELGNNGASSEAQILEFAQRLAGAGRTAGLTVPEIMGLGSTLANLGINAEAGGTAMSRTLQQMFIAVKSGGDDLEGFGRIAGQTGEVFAKTFSEKPVEAVAAFVEGLARIKASGGDVVSALKGMSVESVRQLSMLLQLTTASENVGNAQGQLREQVKLSVAAFQSQNKHLIEADEKAKTFYNQLAKLRNVVNDLLRPLGDQLVEALTWVTIKLQGLAPLVDGLTFAFGKLPTELKIAVFGSLGMAAVAPIALIMGGQLLQSAGAVMQMVQAFKAMQAAQIATTLTGLGTAATTGAGGITLMGLAMKGLFALGITGLLAGIAVGIYKVVGAAQELNTWLDRADGTLGRLKALIAFFSRNANTGQSVFFNEMNPESAAASRPGTEAATTKASRPGARITERGSTHLGSGVKLTDRDVHLGGGGAGAAAPPPVPPAHIDSLRIATEQTAKYTAALKTLGVEKFKIAAQAVEDGKSVKDAATLHGIVEEHLERYIARSKDAAAASRTRAAEEKRAAAEVERETKARTKSIADMLYAANADARRFVEDQTRDAERVNKEGMKRMNDAFLDNSGERLNMLRARTLSEEANEVDSLDKRLRIIAREFEDRRRELDQFSPFYQQNLDEIVAMQAAAADQSTREWQLHVKEVQAAMPGYKKVFRDVLGSLPNLITEALTGGGGFGGAMKAAASQLGSGLMSNLFTDPNGLGQKATQGIASMFGLNAASAFGSMLGPIGSALGAMVGPLLEKLSGLIAGLFNVKKGRNLVEEFAKGFEGGFDGPNGLHAQLLRGGAAGEALWVKLTQGTGQNNPAQAKQHIAEVTEFLKKQAEAQEAAGKATEDAVAQQNAAFDALKAKIASVDTQIQSLEASIANEAPEEVRGVVEMRVREQIEGLKKQREAMQGELDAATTATNTGVAGTAESVGGLGERLDDNADDWEEWSRRARGHIRDVQREVDAVSFGHSPGGLKQIPLELTRSTAALRSFRSAAVGELRDLQRVVDATGGPQLTGTLAGVSGLATGASRPPAAAGDRIEMHVHIRGKDDRELEHFVRDVGRDALLDGRWNVPSTAIVDVSLRRPY